MTQLPHHARLMGALFLLLVCCPPAGRPAEPDPASEMLYAANGLFNRQLYKLAADDYGKFLAAHPKHAKADEARYALALCFYHLDKPREALDPLETLAQKSDFPHAIEVRCLLGQCRLTLNEHDAAEKAFRWVLAKNPKHDMADDAAAGLAETLIARGRWKDAAGQYEDLLKNWPKSPMVEHAHFQAAVARYQLREFDKARGHLDAFLKQQSDSPMAQQARILLGDCWREAKQPDKAAEQYDLAAHKLKGPLRPEALLGLSMARFQAGQFDASVKAAEELRRDFPQSPSLRMADLYRARSLLDLKRAAAAEPILVALAGKKDDLTDDALFWRSRCLVARGKNSDAERLLAQTLKDYAKSNLHAEMQFDLGGLLMTREQFTDAARSFDRLIRDHPKSTLVEEARQLACICLHRAGQYDGSFKRCEEFLKASPKSQWAETIAFLAGENLFLSRKFDEAGKRFKAFLEAYPKSQQIEKARFRLGAAMHAVKRYDEAVAALQPLAGSNDPVIGQAAFFLGDGLFQQRKFAEAVKPLRSFTDRDKGIANRDDALLKLGIALRETGQSDQAVGCFDRLVKEHGKSPLVPRALVEWGQTEYERKRYEPARKRFEQLLSRDGKSELAAVAAYNLGCIAEDEQKWDDAAKHFGRVAETFASHPRAADALCHRGIALSQLERFDEAKSALATFLEKNPDHALADTARLRLGVALAKTGEDRKALEQFERLLKRASGSPGADRALYETAWAYKRLNENEPARAAYGRLLEQFRESPLAETATVELADLEFEDKKYDAAVKRLEPLLAQTQNRALKERILYRLGWCRFEKEEWEPAVRMFERLIEEFPKSDLAAASSYQAGEARIRLKQFEQAIVHYDRIVAGYPTFKLYQESLLRLAESQAQADRFADSEQTASLFLEKFGDSELAHRARFSQGWARENLKRYDAAIAAYRALLESDYRGELAARAQFQIGECLFAKNQLEEAVRELMKVEILYSYPKWNALALLEAGRVLEKMNRPGEARARYAELREKYPKSDEARVAEKRLKDIGQP